MRAEFFVIAGLLMAGPSLAQERQQPSTYVPSALESHAARIEHDATEDIKTDPKGVSWFVDLDAFMPDDKAEYEGLGKYIVLVLAAFSRDRSELPLTAVYSGGVRIMCLASVGRDVLPISATAKAYGKFRSDTLCLLPADLARRSNRITVDFAKSRKGLQISSYPFGEADFIKADRDPTPLPAPNRSVLTKIIQREYPGFGFQVPR